ncbi:conserved hypothetical protein [Cupriavidus necator]|uniref:T3SS negative regulator,GrlR n=1 Tax=Cupriavidus necator TaxID=106590 RepID=A0A1K0JJ90_CUPNE|nr:conserved hypothetical protein [Cupriavidus necator]
MAQQVLDGFYQVNFTALGQGTGLLVIEGDRVRGGDGQYLYSGRLAALDGGAFTIDLRVASYAAGAQSVFHTGQGVFTLKLKGNFVGEEFTATGVAEGVGSGATFNARGRRVKNIDLV